MNDKELSGRVAVVTGAGRNIGRAIALALAEGGGKVAVNGRRNRAAVDSVVGEIEAKGGEAMAAMADVSDEAAVAEMIAAVVRRFGRIDIVVNNAAARPEKPLDAMSLADWRAVMGTILDGAFLLVKGALPHLKKSGAGAIVNIGGLSSHTGTRNRAHVVAAKAGLIGLTRALAHDLAGDGITANCVAPGLIETDMVDANTPMEKILEVIPMQRIGKPEEVAGAVSFLMSADAAYVTRQVISVNGGLC